MPVEFIPASVVRDVSARVDRARGHALEVIEEDPSDDPEYWIALFEANAVAVLDILPLVSLPSEHVVRYCFYGRQRGDLLVRPFIAKAGTDVSAVRRLVDWHPSPDSVASVLKSRPTKDVELLYRHFTFEPSPVGYFEYWIAMQELWASARWVHSRVIADKADFAKISSADGWQIDHEIERYEPAVILEDAQDVQLAVLTYCPLERASISLQRPRIGADQALEFLDAIPVAHGRHGYHLQ